MIYLLDTNIVSYLVNDHIPQLRERVDAIPPHELAISVITQAEMLYGLAKRGNPVRISRLTQEFLDRVAVLPWTSAVAETYAELRTLCEAAGRPLSPADMMIAAHAKHLLDIAQRTGDSAVLVTRDKAFSKIPDSLRIEDWTSA